MNFENSLNMSLNLYFQFLSKFQGFPKSQNSGYFHLISSPNLVLANKFSAPVALQTVLHPTVCITK